MRHGYINAALSPKLRAKARHTLISRYGDQPYKSKEIQKKREETNLQRYGTKNPSQSTIVKNKRRETFLKRFGADHPSRVDEIKKKRQRTFLERFGTSHPLQNKEIKEKQQQTNIIRYGEKTPLLNPEIRAKIERTNVRLYGAVNPFSAKEIQDRISRTIFRRHGVSRPAMLEEIRDKSRRRFLKNRYGFESFDEIRKEFLEVLEKGGINEAISTFGISYQVAMRHLVPEEYKKKGSLVQDQVAKELFRLTGLEFSQNVRSVVPNNNTWEIDIFNRDHKISIEFNGAYWHTPERIQRDIQKATLMRQSGFTHLVIDEAFYWSNGLIPIANLVKPKETLYARTLTLHAPSSDELRKFLDQYHIQGYLGSSVSYGLYKNNQLIQVMTFGKPRYSKSHEWEILRLATHSDYKVVGGAERLFKAFLRDHNPSSIVSYCDFRFFSGAVYERLGMTLKEHTKPGYVWYHHHTKEVLKRYQTQKHKLPKLLKESFDPSLTEVQNMENAGYIQCHDLGQLVFELKKGV